MTVELIAEIIGFLAICIGFLIFQQKKRVGILIFKLSSDILWAIHFLLLGATSGMVLTVVGVLRSITFIILALMGKESRPLWLLLFSTAGVGAIILSWKDVYSICSIISCVLATLGYWQKKPVNTKILSIFVCMSQITYGFFIRSFSVVTNELITLSSIAIFFVRLYAERRREAKSTTTR
jgi:hypothetical protein